METRPQQVQRITKFEETPEYRQFLARKQSLLSDTGNPYFIAHDSPLTDKSYMDGRWVLNFGSYNYAGMSGRQDVSDAAIDAIRPLWHLRFRQPSAGRGKNPWTGNWSAP